MNTLSKTVLSVFVPCALLLSGNVLALENNFLIDGPTHVTQKAPGTFTLKKLGIDNTKIYWFSDYTQYESDNFLKVNKEYPFLSTSVTAGTTLNVPVIYTILQAAVEDNGEYVNVTHAFCQDGLYMKCDSLKGPDRVLGGTDVTLDVSPSKGETQQTYAWNINQNAAKYIKNVKMNRGVLTFTAKKSEESQKLTFNVEVSQKVAGKRQLSNYTHEICVLGIYHQECSAITNPTMMHKSLEKAQLYWTGLDTFKQGSIVQAGGYQYICVDENKCNDKSYNPGPNRDGSENNDMKAARQAWIFNSFPLQIN
ncbi:hypothetical protein BS639_04530 [Rouxiella silvae]|uniref:Uncharacterized protein n=1 Tax=Rouxiella silvae TaxID=1646373 RepID=A0AA40X5U6_9GAMM|nr:hypothetical protein [Rouxiella silvae]MBF6639070.1 hypothetical protein [Rouxiella silvae]ORJ22492.1 hypothetical protein BS639_04530 [Rouxiella silvae]